MELSPPARTTARSRTALACLAVVLAIAAAEAARWTRSARAAAAPSTVQTVLPGRATLSELSRSLIPMPQNTPSAHASAMATLPGDRMLSFWWAGSRESGPDVKVYAARWQDGKWGAPWEVASRDSLGKALGYGVRRIGNPVAWTGRDGRIHLYVVATGLGGWAASRVAHMVSADEGKSFEMKRVLPMSPLFNTSVLVRTNAVGLVDGGWWLPVYFEIGIKYPMMMAFDADGEPTGLGRIGARTTTLQPAIVPVSKLEVRAWMRDASDERRVQHARSHDGGASWEDLPPLELNNENTSMAALRLANGDFLMLHNHIRAGGSSRSLLRLSLSKDGHTWRTAADVASGEAGDEFSYPTMQQVGNELHVTYTYQRRAIAHHRFRISFGESI
ncbi:exo-alpha-sialidase [Massilia sp. LjRoot122]|uniref:exo-alpha-sialidase n=1 Tax=Massilia sp. LjRoot122 TaxID=3342257 RepID=UPI003ECDB7D0